VIVVVGLGVVDGFNCKEDGDGDGFDIGEGVGVGVGEDIRIGV
jgi:hypothetical protein